MRTWRKKGRRGMDTPVVGESDSTVPGPRAEFSAQVDRAMVVAEAKMLVQELDKYLELIGAWAAEGWDEADATQ